VEGVTRDVHDGVGPARGGHTHLIDERDDAHGYAGPFSCTTHTSPSSRIEQPTQLTMARDKRNAPFG
jgi:hypothetical protein